MVQKHKVPFNLAYATGNELAYIEQAINEKHLSGDGRFTKNCHTWLEQKTGSKKALLTHSCTAALEMAAILADIQPGDEVIMPSFTFVSTANAFVLRGAVPVFVDVRPDTHNIDESKIEQAITKKTKAIVPVHYAGVACEMDSIMDIANRHNLIVIEDAAQGLMSFYKGRALGSIGHFAAISFHETKNIISGEGGALLINAPKFIERAEIIREKGTNRSKFFRGAVDKYTWVDIGSSFLPSDLIAAFLWAQMEQAEEITARRLEIWKSYHRKLSALQASHNIQLPYVPANCQHNAHMYYILLPDLEKRTACLKFLSENRINAVFHYIPLHSSPAGKKFGRVSGSMKITEDIGDRLIRLPLWIGMAEQEVETVADAINAYLLQQINCPQPVMKALI
ncbi:MAG: rffA [Gammaproteobacteria bacterium]|jgi:dTDP-4-amino-4,6-dideoxygalactose transaminase|nr:rffA [Gammaproteobacteria bacterium]